MSSKQHLLLELRRQDVPYNEIARRLNRSSVACRIRFYRLANDKRNMFLFSDSFSQLTPPANPSTTPRQARLEAQSRRPRYFGCVYCRDSDHRPRFPPAEPVPPVEVVPASVPSDAGFVRTERHEVVPTPTIDSELLMDATSRTVLGTGQPAGAPKPYCGARCPLSQILNN